MTDIEYRILENQELILLGISKILTPQCKGMLRDSNEETKKNNHATKYVNKFICLTRNKSTRTANADNNQ